MPAPDGIPENVWSAARAAPLWAEASDDAVAWLAQLSYVEEFPRGSNLYIEGEIPDYVALVMTGHARAIHHAEDVDERDVVIENYWPGEVVGAVSTLSETPFESDIEAVETVTALLVPVDALKDLLHSEPDAAMSVIHEFSRRWINSINMTKRNSVEVHTRVAQYLSELPRTVLGPHAYAVEIPMPRGELAALLGTTPETLSRAFHTLQEDGLVEAHDRLVVVPDGRALVGRRASHAHVDVERNEPANGR